MYTMFLYILIGILIWQLVCFIATAITNGSDESCAFTCGIPYLIWYVIAKFILKPFFLFYYRHRYDGYIFCWVKDGKIDRLISMYYMTKKQAKRFYTKEDDSKFYIEKVSDGRNFKSIPYKGDIIKNNSLIGVRDKKFFDNWIKEKTV